MGFWLLKKIPFLQCDDDCNTRDKSRKASWRKGSYQLYNLYLNLHQHRLGDDWLENSFAKKGLGCSGEWAEHDPATCPYRKGSRPPGTHYRVCFQQAERASFLSIQSWWYCSWSPIPNSAPSCERETCAYWSESIEVSLSCLKYWIIWQTFVWAFERLRAEMVEPQAGKACGHLINVFKYLNERGPWRWT